MPRRGILNRFGFDAGFTFETSPAETSSGERTS